jgi:hypothetical protein
MESFKGYPVSDVVFELGNKRQDFDTNMWDMFKNVGPSFYLIIQRVLEFFRV